MTFRETSFWRNYVKLYLQYMAVGVAAIPAGALYAFLASRGYESRWTALLAIIIGCLCSRLAWKFVDRQFAAPLPEMAFSELSLIEIRGSLVALRHQEALLATLMSPEEPNTGAVAEQSGLSEAQPSKMGTYAAAAH